MEKPKRPGPVSAVAYLCLAFGGLGLVMYLCGIGVFGLLGYVMANPPEVQPGQPDPFSLLRKLDQIVPVAKYHFPVQLIMTWLLCLLEVIAGLRLLKMRYSGRRLVIIYAIAAIFLELASFGVYLSFLGPKMPEVNKVLMDWMQEAMPKPAGNAAQNGGPPPKEGTPAGGPAPVPANPFATNPALNAAMSIGGLAVGLLYPGIIILIMMMPKIRRAFAIANGDAPPDDADVDTVRPAGTRDAPPHVSSPEDVYRYQAPDE